jgi:nucleolar protein 56
MQHINTWFGIFSVENGSIISCDLYNKDARTLAHNLIKTPGALGSSMICGIDIRTLAKEWGFVDSDEEYDSLFREVNIEYAAHQAAAAVTDEHIIFWYIETMDELDRINNVLSERLKDFYNLNVPDAQLPGSCVENINHMASGITGLQHIRAQFSRYIETYMIENFPNLVRIAGAGIGARLLRIAGGVMRLSSMPSGTIQVLGAHNALFKHLKGSAPSPKHGVIFQHPLIRESPWWLRGRIARLLASRISMAVRIDYYSGDYRQEIHDDLNRRVKILRQKYPEPPG